jgi:antitoxin component YwqK of YwqJK toxin-antitoxin module
MNPTEISMEGSRMQDESQSPTPYTKHHRNGSVWARGQKLGDVPVGYWEWFRIDGTKLRSGSFENGEQSGEWTTYDRDGNVYKVTTIKPKRS